MISAASVVACGADAAAPESAGPAGVVHSNGDGYAGRLVQDPPLRPADVILHDTHDKPYHLRRLSPERVTALFFGYTNCNDVCPTTMADLAAVRRALPTRQAQRVEVVFITVDPVRDTTSVLERWLERFDTGFVGLRGSEATVHRAERSLYTVQSKAAHLAGERDHHGAHSGTASHGADYEVSHSGLVYVFGPRGQSLFYSGGTTVSEYVRDFRRLLAAP